MSRIFTLQLAVMLLFGLVLSLEIPLVLKLMTPQEFWVSGNLAFLAITSKILFGAYYHMNFGLAYEKMTFKISLIQISAAVLSVVLNLAFVYLYGFAGALLASVATYFFQCVISHYIARKYYSIPFEWLKIAKMVTVMVLLFFVIDKFTLSHFSLDNWLNRHFGPLISDILYLLSLGTLKEGKFLALVMDNVPLIVDGFLKLVFSLSFVLCLVWIDVISKHQLLQPVKLLKKVVLLKKVNSSES